MKKWEIAVIPGDGIGKEVVPAALDVLKAVADVHGGISFSFTEFPWSCDYYMEHGKMMPDDGLETLRNFDAISLERSAIRSLSLTIFRYGGCF